MLNTFQHWTNEAQRLRRLLRRKNREWADYSLPYLTWRKTRVTPPHCLECGSTQITHSTIDETSDIELSRASWLRGHYFYSTTRILPGIVFRIYYTPEGENLASYEVFPCTGMVTLD